MLAQLEQHREAIQSAGLRAAAVGIGEPKHAAHWCGRLAPALTCLVSKTVDVHLTYGLSRSGLASLLNPKLYATSLRAAASGFTQGKATGDIAMLGGIFVVDREGLIRYAYANEVAGDYPPIPEVIKSISP